MKIDLDSFDPSLFGPLPTSESSTKSLLRSEQLKFMRAEQERIRERGVPHGSQDGRPRAVSFTIPESVKLVVAVAAHQGARTKSDVVVEMFNHVLAAARKNPAHRRGLSEMYKQATRGRYSRTGNKPKAMTISVPFDTACELWQESVDTGYEPPIILRTAAVLAAKTAELYDSEDKDS